MNKQCLRIEFLGISGSGKTYLSHKLAKGVEKLYPIVEMTNKLTTNHKLMRVTLKLVVVFCQIMRHPLQSITLIKAIKGTKQKRLIDLIKNTINILYVVRLQRQGHPRFITLYDQGLFQALWSVWYSATEKNSDSLVSLIDKLVHYPLLVIIVEAELNVVKERLIQRIVKRGSLQSRVEPTNDMLTEVSDLMKEIIDICERTSLNNPNIVIMYVQNNGDTTIMEDTKRRIIQLMKTTLT